MSNCRHCGHVIEFIDNRWIHLSSDKAFCWDNQHMASP